MAYCVAGSYTIQNNLGIGTETPATTLDAVCSPGDGNWHRLVVRDSSNGAAFAGVYRNGSTYSQGIFSHTGDLGAWDNLWVNAHNDCLGNVAGGTTKKIIMAGSVGIGTFCPTQQLHIACSVVGNMGITVQNLNASYSSQIRFLDSAGTEKSAITFVPSDTGLYFFHNGSNRMVINSSGNVGIGTTSPSTTLHVNGFARVLGVSVNETGGTVSSFIGYEKSWLGTGTSNDLAIASEGSNNIKFYTNGTTSVRMMINTSGNVGIGTTSPNRKLTISRATESTSPQLEFRNEGGISDGNFDGISFTQGATGDVPLGSIRLKNATNGYPGFGIYTRNANTTESEKVTIANDGATCFSNTVCSPLFVSTGCVAIGTTGPSTKLHVVNNVNRAYTPTVYNDTLHAVHIQFCDQNQRAGLIRFTSHGNLENSFGVVQMGCSNGGASCGQGDFVFQAYRTAGGNLYCELMRITNQGCVYFNGGGNVGIGTSSPSQLLHVVNTSADAEKGIIVANNNAGTSAHASLRIDGYAGSYIDFYRNTGFRWRFQRIAFSDDFKITADTGNGGAGDVMYFDYDTGRVGMRVTSPNHTLSLDGNVGVVGYNWKLQSDSDGNWGFGLCNSGTTYYTYLTYAADATADRRGGIFNVAGNNWIAYGNCVNNFIVTNCVGVATTTPTYRLHVNGTFYAAGSSIKYKEGICHYDTNSCLFMCLKPVTYQYKDEFKHLGKELKSGIQIGLIAEDVAEVMPELAVLVNEEDEKVVRNVDYEKLSIVLLAEVQKLRREVDTLKNN